MRSLKIQIGSHELEALQAETSRERRQGMRLFQEPCPLLLSGAPLIHTWGCSNLDLVWIRRGRVVATKAARSRRLYFCPAWLCLELPPGLIQSLSIRKEDPFCVLAEN